MNNTRLASLLLAETVRLVEANAPLDDAEANRHAAAAHVCREERLMARADWLGRRLGLQEELQAWRARAGVVWPALALLVFVVGYGLVDNLLGDSRTINAVLAFMVTLGVHFLSLALWLLSLCLAGTPASGALARLSLGNLSLWLAGRRSGQGDTPARKLLPAAWSMLERARMLPWLLGLISHVVWAAAFLLALCGLWFMFSFREYQLTWETTIQGSEFFVRFIEFTGVLPRHLGFPTPGAAALTDAGADSAARDRAIAYWLIGCTFTYGLLPRVLLAILAAAVVARRRARLGLDTTDPYFRKLLARLDEIGRTATIDPERPAARRPDTYGPVTPSSPRSAALVGFELPPESAWPPPGLVGPEALTINVSGAGDQSRDALQSLSAAGPSHILFVVDQAASPDRGTARFLRQAAACGRRAAIFLLPRGENGEAGMRRWQAWLAENVPQPLHMVDNVETAAAWLKGTHE